MNDLETHFSILWDIEQEKPDKKVFFVLLTKDADDGIIAGEVRTTVDTLFQGCTFVPRFRHTVWCNVSVLTSFQWGCAPLVWVFSRCVFPALVNPKKAFLKAHATMMNLYNKFKIHIESKERSRHLLSMQEVFGFLKLYMQVIKYPAMYKEPNTENQRERCKNLANCSVQLRSWWCVL